MILTVSLNPAIDYNVFGESFVPRATNRGTDMSPEPGGKGNNAARIARLLGTEVTATGILGGFTGDFIRSRLEAEGIHTDFLAGAGVTRITTAFIEADPRVETKIAPYGPEVSRDDVAAFRSHFEKLLREAPFSIAVLCGLPPRGAPDGLYGDLIEIARRHSVPVVLDTSGAALRSGCAAGPYMIKPNRVEAAELAGSSDDEVIYRRMRELASGIGVVALTLGEEGAVFFEGEKVVKVSPHQGGTVNPVCAGDAFVGAFAAAFDRFGPGDDRALRWAVAAGACTACAPGLLWPATDFEDALASVTVEELPA